MLGVDVTERRRSRTYPAVGYTTWPVLKTGWTTGSCRSTAYGSDAPSEATGASRLREVGATGAHGDLPPLREVGHLDHALHDAHLRTVAAVGSEPVRAANGRGGVPAARSKASGAVAPELPHGGGEEPGCTALLPLGADVEVTGGQPQLHD